MLHSFFKKFNFIIINFSLQIFKRKFEKFSERMAMENILEDQRRFHEERERLIDVQTKEILRKKATVSKYNRFDLYDYIF